MCYLSIGRPILLYRSSLHKPGNIDPVAFTRFADY